MNHMHTRNWLNLKFWHSEIITKQSETAPFLWVFLCVLVSQSCPTLCDPMDCNPPGFSVYGILRARILEWVAIPFSRGSSWPREITLPGRLYHLSHQGSPQENIQIQLNADWVEVRAGDKLAWAHPSCSWALKRSPKFCHPSRHHIPSPAWWRVAGTLSWCQEGNGHSWV